MGSGLSLGHARNDNLQGPGKGVSPAGAAAPMGLAGLTCGARDIMSYGLKRSGRNSAPTPVDDNVEDVLPAGPDFGLDDVPDGMPRYFVQSLARGLDVVRAFGPDSPTLTLGEIARRTGMSRAAARRYVLTLRDLGYIEARGLSFELKPRLLELGYSYLSSLPLWKVAEPVLTKLVGELGESCSIAVLDIPDIVYVARVAVKRIVTSDVSIGTRLPAFATTMGRVLLAGMPPDDFESYLSETEFRPITRFTVTDRDELRTLVRTAGERGYALMDEEFEIGLRSIAVPIHDSAGRVVAALNVSTQSSRTDFRSLTRKFLNPLLQGSRSITVSLPQRPAS